MFLQWDVLEIFCIVCRRIIYGWKDGIKKRVNDKRKLILKCPTSCEVAL